MHQSNNRKYDSDIFLLCANHRKMSLMRFTEISFYVVNGCSVDCTGNEVSDVTVTCTKSIRRASSHSDTKCKFTSMNDLTISV